jgi:hypothetical protein
MKKPYIVERMGTYLSGFSGLDVDAIANNLK